MFGYRSCRFKCPNTIVQLTVSASTCSGIVPTVENSLAKEKLSNVQMASVLEQFVSVTQ